jgi:hypothetical protein
MMKNLTKTMLKSIFFLGFCALMMSLPALAAFAASTDALEITEVFLNFRLRESSRSSV